MLTNFICILKKTQIIVAATKQPGVYNDDIIHIATANPISLYSMNPRKQHVTCIDLYDIFPHMKSHFRPKVKVCVLGFPLDNNVVLHEAVVSLHFIKNDKLEYNFYKLEYIYQYWGPVLSEWPSCS